MPYPITSVLLSIRGADAVAAAPSSSLLTGLAGFWNLADTTDNSGNGNTLTNNNSVSFANDGLQGKCATFDGTNYLSIASSSSLSSTGSLTIAGWMYLASIGSSERLVSKWSLGQYRVYKESDVFKANVGASGDVGASLGGFSANTWYSFFVVYDSVGQTVQVWVNNSSTNGPTSYAGGLTNTASPFAIGAADDGTTFMTGRLNMVGVWTKAFTAGERTCFQNGGAGTIYPFTGLCT